MSITQEAGLWLWVFGPLRERHDLVMIDQRGVGRSGLIDCEPLQHNDTEAPPYAATAACGAQLGDAASLYGSGDVARDIEAVRAALGVPRLIFYGHSYAGVDAQAYAARYPRRLRAIALDSPSPTDTFDPWYADDLAAMRRGIRVLCAGSATCSSERSAAGADAELAWLARRLRDDPVDGVVRDAQGTPHTLHITEAFLATHLAISDAGGFVAPSEIPAAAAALRRSDRAPLLRLAAENDGHLYGDSGDPIGFSAGDNEARFCTDNTFQWDKAASPSTRRAQWAAARDGLAPQQFAPFSAAAWSQYFNPDLCIEWPAAGKPVERPVPAGTTFPSIPVLVLAGELDTRVPLEKSRDVAALFPDSRFVRIAETGHGTVFNTECARGIAQRFLATLDAGDTSCANHRELRYPAAGGFPTLARYTTPASTVAGDDHSTRRDRKVAAAAAAAVTDAFRRSFLTDSGGPGLGLRGGTFNTTFDDTGAAVELSAARFVGDVSVTGHAIRPWETQAIDATVQVAGPAGHDGNLSITGRWFTPDATTLSLRGVLGGRRVSLIVPAT